VGLLFLLAYIFFAGPKGLKKLIKLISKKCLGAVLKRKLSMTFLPGFKTRVQSYEQFTPLKYSKANPLPRKNVGIKMYEKNSVF
jgi:hypothetical protein